MSETKSAVFKAELLAADLFEMVFLFLNFLFLRLRFFCIGKIYPQFSFRRDLLGRKMWHFIVGSIV